MNDGVTGTGTDEAQSATAQTLKQAQASSGPEGLVASWQAFEEEGVSISHRQPVTYLTWHSKGDYFASVAPTGESAASILDTSLLTILTMYRKQAVACCCCCQ